MQFISASVLTKNGSYLQNLLLPAVYLLGCQGVPSELQTNVCVVNHLSDTRAEKRRREKETRQTSMKEVEYARKDTEKRQWGMREEEGGQLTLYSWSWTSHEVGLEYQTQIPPPTSSTPSASSWVLPTSPSLPSSSPQNRFPRQHHRRSEVRCGVGWGGWVSECGSIWMSDLT